MWIVCGLFGCGRCLYVVVVGLKCGIVLGRFLSAFDKLVWFVLLFFVF